MVPDRTQDPRGPVGGLKAAFAALADRIRVRFARPIAFAERIGRHDAGGLAAELAYRFFLALFPFVIFLTALGALIAHQLGVADPSGDIVRTFGATLPTEVASLITDELRAVVERRDVGLLSIGGIAALIAATGGTNAALKGVQRAYGLPKGRPFLRAYVAGFGLTLLGGWAIVGLFVLFVGLQVTGAEVFTRLGIEPVWRALLVLRWILALPVLVGVGAVLYRYGTTLRPAWRPVLAGAFLFAVAWLGVTAIFALYVNTIANYGATYGTLAGVAGLLVWFYFSALVLVLGAEVTGWLIEPT